jgi:hypothetical protein
MGDTLVCVAGPYLRDFAHQAHGHEVTCADALDAESTHSRCTMTEDAAPLESPAGDLARLRNSVNDVGGRIALKRVAQRLSELAADNEALRNQVTERGSAQEASPESRTSRA